jgi:hypothetical protein
MQIGGWMRLEVKSLFITLSLLPLPKPESTLTFINDSFVRQHPYICGAAFVKSFRQQNALKFLVITGHEFMSYFVVKPVSNKYYQIFNAGLIMPAKSLKLGGHDAGF